MHNKLKRTYFGKYQVSMVYDRVLKAVFCWIFLPTLSTKKVFYQRLFFTHFYVHTPNVISFTGKSLSEARIFASTNSQNDDRLFIELQVQYMKIPSSNLGRTCCVQKLFLIFRTVSVHNMFSPCSAKKELLTKMYLYYSQHSLTFQKVWKT